MRQLKNKHYDTKEGASGYQAEIVSSTSSSLVSKQKDEMMKHTKGQWSIKKTSFSDEIDSNCAVNSTKYLLLTDTTMFRNKNLIADIVGSEEEAQANANLIASAPEMLEILKEILDAYIETDDCDLSELLYKKINDIIAKAEGGE